MTDYFGIIAKYFGGKQDSEFRNGFLSKYFIGDTTVMWNSNDKNMYIGASGNSHWSFVYKAHYTRLYSVTGKLDSTDLDPRKSLIISMDDICKAIATGGVTGLRSLYDVMYMDKVLP